MYFLNFSGQNGGKTLFIFLVRKLLGKLCLETTLIFFQNSLAISWLDRWVCARPTYNTVVCMNSIELYFVAQFNRKYKKSLFPAALRTWIWLSTYHVCHTPVQLKHPQSRLLRALSSSKDKILNCSSFYTYLHSNPRGAWGPCYEKHWNAVSRHFRATPGKAQTINCPQFALLSIIIVLSL